MCWGIYPEVDAVWALRVCWATVAHTPTSEAPLSGSLTQCVTVNNTGATALHHAAWWGQAPCVEVLLQHAAQATDGSDGGGSNSSSRLGGPRLAETSTTTGLTPLHWAAWRGQVGVGNGAASVDSLLLVVPALLWRLQVRGGHSTPRL